MCPTVAGGLARLWSPRERRKRRWPGGGRREHGRCSHWVVGAGLVLGGGRRAQWSDRRGRERQRTEAKGAQRSPEGSRRAVACAQRVVRSSIRVSALRPRWSRALLPLAAVAWDGEPMTPVGV